MHSLSLKKASAAALAIGASFCFAGNAAAGDHKDWTGPDCKQVNGAPNITFTRNEGAKLKQTAGEMDLYSYTFGLVPLEKPNTLLASVGSKIIRSTDVGCNWQPLADLGEQTGGSLLILEPAGGSRAYGWAVNSNALATIDGDNASSTWVPGSGVTGLSVSRKEPMKLRFGDTGGTIYSSTNGGQDWTSIKGAGYFVYRTAFAKKNPDHLMVGTMSQGAFTSFDGGTTWQRALGFAAAKTSVNVFNIVFSPVDENLVWAMAIDISEVDTAPHFGRHIYRSTDGGLNFARVVDQSESVVLTNGPLMVPHPKDPAVLYFVFGTSFDNYGTDLYRYDHTTGKVTLTHNQYAEIGSIAFHPRNANLMWLGLVKD